MTFGTFPVADLGTGAAGKVVDFGNERRRGVGTFGIRRHPELGDGIAPDRHDLLAVGRGDVHQAGVVRDDRAGVLHQGGGGVQAGLAAGVEHQFAGTVAQELAQFFVFRSSEQHHRLLQHAAKGHQVAVR